MSYCFIRGNYSLINTTVDLEKVLAADQYMFLIFFAPVLQNAGKPLTVPCKFIKSYIDATQGTLSSVEDIRNLFYSGSRIWCEQNLSGRVRVAETLQCGSGVQLVDALQNIANKIVVGPDDVKPFFSGEQCDFNALTKHIVQLENQINPIGKLEENMYSFSIAYTIQRIIALRR